VALLIQYLQSRGRIGTSTSAGNRYEFNAVTVDRDGVFERVTNRATWLSSNENVARPGGASNFSVVFLPVGPGTANAIVRFAGMEATAPMVVVESALLDVYPRLNLVSPGTTPQAVFREGSLGSQSRNVNSSASWDSSDTRIATVSATGQVTRVGIGTTIITATFNGFSDWFWISFGPPAQ
jgi:hypothetical protein